MIQRNKRIMPKDEWIHIRVDTELKEKIQDAAKDYEYEDMASFVRAIIIEKLSKTKEDQLKETRALIRQALEEDPTLLDESLRRIGIRFYARQSDDQSSNPSRDPH